MRFHLLQSLIAIVGVLGSKSKPKPKVNAPSVRPSRSPSLLPSMRPSPLPSYSPSPPEIPREECGYAETLRQLTFSNGLVFELLPSTGVVLESSTSVAYSFETTGEVYLTGLTDGEICDEYGPYSSYTTWVVGGTLENIFLNLGISPITLTFTAF
jgi:hypothetical protein